MSDHHDLLHRSIDTILPSADAYNTALTEAEKSGKKLRGYLGIDPTSPHLHIGHTVALRNLARFQRAGHHAILLIGDFTARLGDPDKLSTREPLSKEKVEENMATYLDQVRHILDFDGPNPVEVRHNSEWSDPMTFGEIIKLAAHFTVQQMLERDMFQKRLQEQRSISLSEFFYPLMQGYDAVMLEADVQFGGTDQTFNMLAGRTLNRVLRNREMYVVANPLLADGQGVKIGKTMGNAINIDNPPQELYGQIMSLPDEVIIPGFTLLTDRDEASIATYEKELASGANPMTHKMDLAHTIVEQYHGLTASDDAAGYFAKTVQRKEFDDEAQIVELDRAVWNTVELLVKIQAVDSKSEARRLLDQQAIQLNGQIVTTSDIELQPANDLKVGKRRFYKLQVQEKQ